MVLAQTDSAQVGLIQNYILHTGWQWESKGFSFLDLKGNEWNEVEFVLPSHVDPLSVQSVGISFKTIGVDIGENSVYIDDIYFNKSEDPTNVDDLELTPNEFNLFTNYPNPFNPSTKIKFNVPKTTKVNLNIYDVIGRQVKTLVNEIKKPGSYEVVFEASDLASGVYFYTLNAGSFFQSKKMLLLK
jgi:hypothetical protein